MAFILQNMFFANLATLKMC